MFRAVQAYDGTDSEHCITLHDGDVLTAVEVVDEYWCIGHNERSKQNGAFPASFVSEIKDKIKLPTSNTIKDRVPPKRPPCPKDKTEVVEIEKDNAKKELDSQTSMENIAKRGLQRLKTSDKFGVIMASTDMLFKSGRDENTKMKAALGVCTGVMIGVILYFLLVYSFDYSPIVAGIMVALVTILMCVALAIRSACRCVMALVFPNFFTSKGRGVLMSVILSLILSGPIQNITNNARETGSSMACIAEVVANQTKAMRQQLAEPMIEMAEYVTKNQRKLREAQAGITQHFDTFMQEYDKIDKELKGFTDQLNAITTECQRKINEQVNKCNDGCGIISFACPCEVLNELKEACKITSFSGDISNAKNGIRREFKKFENYFQADVVIKGNFDTFTNQSNNVENIKANVDNDINVTVDTFKEVKAYATYIMSSSLLLMFLTAFWYFRNYMANDSYDNQYITKEFIELDKEWASKGETPILPLKKRELSKYIQSRSLRLTSVELEYCRKGVVQVLLLLLLCAIMIFGDFCLFYVLNLVNRFGKLVVRLDAKAEFKIRVKGDGPIAAFYKVFLSDFDIAKHYLNDIDVNGCLPAPTPPSFEYSLTSFVVLFVILFCVVILRGYGMRLRRKIAAYYYPEQEKQRLEYLHKKIKHERQAYQRFIRQEVKSAHKESVMKEKFRLSSWLKLHCPCLNPCISSGNLTQCSSCEETDQQLLAPCGGVIEGVTCTAIYCEECRCVLKGVCPLCYNSDVQFRR